MLCCHVSSFNISLPPADTSRELISITEQKQTSDKSEVSASDAVVCEVQGWIESGQVLGGN